MVQTAKLIWGSRTFSRFCLVFGLLGVAVQWRIGQAVGEAYATGWVPRQYYHDLERVSGQLSCNGCTRLPDTGWIVVYVGCGVLGLGLLLLAFLSCWRRNRELVAETREIPAVLWSGLILASAAIVATAVLTGLSALGNDLLTWAAITEAVAIGSAGVMLVILANIKAQAAGSRGLATRLQLFFQRQRVNVVVLALLSAVYLLVGQTSPQAVDSIRVWWIGQGKTADRFYFGLASTVLLALVVYESATRLGARALTNDEPGPRPMRRLLIIGSAMLIAGIAARAFLPVNSGIAVAGGIAVVLALLEYPKVSPPKEPQQAKVTLPAFRYEAEYLALVPLLTVAIAAIRAGVDASLTGGVNFQHTFVFFAAVGLGVVAVLMTLEREPAGNGYPWSVAASATVLIVIVGAVLMFAARGATASELGGAALLFTVVGYVIVAFRLRPRRRPGTAILVALVLGALIMVLTEFDVHGVGARLGTIGAVNIGIAALLGAAYFAVAVTLRYRPPKLLWWLGLRQFPILTLVLLWWLGAGLILSPNVTHDVRIVQETRASSPVALPVAPTLVKAFDAWRAAQPEYANKLPGTAPVPLVLVAAHGGGIKAAYWTAVVLDCIVGESPHELGPGAVKYFSNALAQKTCSGTRRRPTWAQALAARRIFLGSGVSGGAVGLFAYADQLVTSGNLATTGNVPWYDNRLGGDFASAAVTWGLYHDLPNHFLGLHSSDGGNCTLRIADGQCASQDRGAVIEDEFDRLAQGGPQPTHPPLLRQTWDDRKSRDATTRSHAKSVPLLVTNGTVTGGAARVLISAADLSTWPTHEKSKNARPVDGVVEASAALCATGDIRLSTAAMMGARFPYVTPSARIETGCKGETAANNPGSACLEDDCTIDSVDGGYVDNTGLSTIDDLWPALMRLVLDFNRTATHPIVPVVLDIDNHYQLVSQPPIAGAGTSEESIIPIATLEGGRHTVETDAVDRAHRSGWCIFTLSPAQHPGLNAPLGWELSGDSRSDLRNALWLPHPSARGAGRFNQALTLRKLQGWLTPSAEQRVAGRSFDDGLSNCLPHELGGRP